jgi:hypothetical protein
MNRMILHIYQTRYMQSDSRVAFFLIMQVSDRIIQETKTGVHTPKMNLHHIIETK